jgi:hypothetical protein
METYTGHIRNIRKATVYLIRVYPSIDNPAEEVVEDMSQPFSVQHAVKSSHKNGVLQISSILKLNKNKFPRKSPKKQNSFQQVLVKKYFVTFYLGVEALRRAANVVRISDDPGNDLNLLRPHSP